MGIGVLVLGESGTGKSCSIRNFEDSEISIINVDGKPLPMKKKFSKIVTTDNAVKIAGMIGKSKSKVIVIDDCQYIMANEYMRRAHEKGYEKYSEIGCNFFNLIESVKELPEDTVVYFLSHVEETNSGTIKCKTIGKMLDSTITIEGKFSIVLRTIVKDGNFFFSTQNSGFDTVKTPLGMFDKKEIENDLKAVDTAIREYYGLKK